MLDVGSRQGDIARWIYSLPCHVQLPQKLRDELEKTGAAPVPSDDVRRHRRMLLPGRKASRGAGAQAESARAARETAWQSVYTSDFSKQGCSFLHSAILYPGERLRLILLTGVERTIEVAWCRRLDKNCYAIGGRIHRDRIDAGDGGVRPCLQQPSELNAGLEGLLERLASLAEDSQPADAESRPATPQRRQNCRASAPAREDELPTQPAADAAAVPVEEAFFPAAPRSLADTHVAESEIEGIILRLLMYRGTSTGVEISQQIGLPFPVTEKLLHALKTERLLVFKSVATLSDYVYEITDLGLQRARQSAVDCSYCGAVPVSLGDYRGECCRAVAQPRETAHGKPPPRLRRSDDQPRNVRPPRPRHHVRAGALPARPSRQRQDQHRGTDHGRLRHEHLDSPRDQRVGEIIRLFDPSCHEELPLATRRADCRRREDRSSLGANPPAHHRRRRRTDDGKPGDHRPQGDGHRRSAHSDEEQRRDAW